MEEKYKIKIRNFLEYGFYMVLAIVVIYFILTYIGQRTIVHGSSMYPTLKDGDQLVVEKLSYRFGKPERFDVIVFNYYDSGNDTPVHYIKRVIGLPGETISIEGGKIYIDGEVLEETYGYYDYQQIMEGYDFSEPTLIGENEYFVLGDNRNESLDSRKIGCIEESDIIGKAVFRLYPFQTIGTIR